MTMDGRPHIGIVIPSLNGFERYSASCAVSMHACVNELNRHGYRVTIVVVDDGSAVDDKIVMSEYGQEFFGRNHLSVADHFMNIFAAGVRKHPNLFGHFEDETRSSSLSVTDGRNTRFVSVRSHEQLGKVSALSLGVDQFEDSPDLIAFCDDDMVMQYGTMPRIAGRLLRRTTGTHPTGGMAPLLRMQAGTQSSKLQDFVRAPKAELEAIGRAANQIFSLMQSACGPLSDLGQTPWLPGGFSMFTRQALIDSGAFTELVARSPRAGEDWMLTRFLLETGFRTEQVPDCEIYSFAPHTWKQLHGMAVRSYQDPFENFHSVARRARSAGRPAAASGLAGYLAYFRDSSIGQTALQRMRARQDGVFEQRINTGGAADKWMRGIDLGYRERVIESLSHPLGEHLWSTRWLYDADVKIDYGNPHRPWTRTQRDSDESSLPPSAYVNHSHWTRDIPKIGCEPPMSL